MDEALHVAAPAAARTARPAFDEFFASHRDRLFAALWLVCRDRWEAEELAQDAFVEVWERWERVGGLEDPAGYLYRTAMNLYRNRRRRAALALRRVVRAAPQRDEIAALEDRDAIVRALRTVTPRQRAALVLTDLLDLTSEDAARALGVRAPTVRVLAARARAAIRDEIGGDDG
jgi:RNA polymerase sigma factor (sigma-70 family)